MAALAHLMLAVGLFPLILATMIYFTPVLTRSGPIPGWVHGLPWLAMVAGGLGWVAVWQAWWLVGVAAPLAGLTVAGALWWIARRAAGALGSPHPGLRWYQAALVCLMLGLLAILATLIWPGQWLVWRALHRHLNLLGFVGLAAMGTLQVLLPTVGGYADPMASQRLRVDLKYAVLGAVLMAGGAAFWPWLSGFGLGAWGWVLGRLLRPLAGHVGRIVRANGATLSLLSALVGFFLCLISALFQGGAVPLPLFFALFLFPLVTGALAHLLPLWWWPGHPTPQRQAAQQSLGRFALLRVAALWVGGGGLLVGEPGAIYWVAAPLLLFLGQVVWLMRVRETVPICL